MSSRGISRRLLLSSLPLALAAQVRKPSAAKAKPLPAFGEFTRFIDPVTENIVVRLTTPTSSALLPDSHNRFISAKERFLIFSSDRSGRFAPYQVDLRTGSLRQLADPANLNPRSLCLDQAEKTLYFLDGNRLMSVILGHANPTQRAEDVAAFGLSSGTGAYLIRPSGDLLFQQGDKPIQLAQGARRLWPSPHSGGCLFSRQLSDTDSELFYARSDAGQAPALLASGAIRQPFWEASGQSILFLRDSKTPNGVTVTEIRGKALSDQSEYPVCPTSQFACFAPNSDDSVFVGASRSRAQPDIVLTLRSPVREMTLCEHRASRPADVFPVFSPDNRRIYFESDIQGKPAVYSVNVELLVEPA